jgi:hypothetical protein
MTKANIISISRADFSDCLDGYHEMRKDIEEVDEILHKLTKVATARHAYLEELRTMKWAPLSELIRVMREQDAEWKFFKEMLGPNLEPIFADMIQRVDSDPEIYRLRRALAVKAIQQYAIQRGKPDADAEEIVRSIEDGSFWDDAEPMKGPVNGYAIER